MRMPPVRSTLAGAALVLAVALSGCGGAATTPAAPAGVSTMDTSTLAGHVNSDIFLAAVQQEGVTVIDVRTPEEFAAGHLPGAININVESPAFASEIAALDKEGTYALYCRSANRSRLAENVMIADGFGHVFGLDGGVTALDPSELVTGSN